MTSASSSFLSISSLLFSCSSPSWRPKMSLINDYRVMLFKEVDSRVLTPWQKCNLAFSWVAGTCEDSSGSWKPTLAAFLVGLPDENLVKAYCHRFHRAHLHLELRVSGILVHGSEMQIFPWGLGDLCSCWSSRKSRLVIRCWSPWAAFVWDLPGLLGQEWELSSPIGLGYSLQARKWGLCFHGR